MNKKKKVIYCAVIVVLVVAIVATAVLIKNRSDSGADKNEQKVPESAKVTEEIPVGMEYNQKIETPFITFCYPEEWEENVEIIAGEEGDAYVVTLKELVSADNIELFSIAFTDESEAGTLLGSVDGQNVFAEVKVIEAKESWTDEEITRINLIQGYINDFIEQLNNSKEFIPA